MVGANGCYMLLIATWAVLGGGDLLFDKLEVINTQLFINQGKKAVRNAIGR